LKYSSFFLAKHSSANSCGVRSPSELWVRSVLVLDAPRFDDPPRLCHRDEPVFVQALVTELPLKLSMYAFSLGLPGRMNEHWFVTMAQARRIIEAWRIEYNTERTHSSLGDLTPQEFADECLARKKDGVSSHRRL